MSIKSKPFGVRGWLRPFWKHKMVNYNMLEYKDCKMKIEKFRKFCMSQNGIKMQPRS